MVSEDGWQVEAKPAPPELAEGFPRADYEAPTPLHADLHGWFEIGKRLTDRDREALIRAGLWVEKVTS